MPAPYAICLEVLAIDSEDSPHAQRFGGGNERCSRQIHRMISVRTDPSARRLDPTTLDRVVRPHTPCALAQQPGPPRHISLHGFIKTFVQRAARHRREAVPVFLRVSRGRMALQRFRALPFFNYREMIRPHRVL